MTRRTKGVVRKAPNERRDKKLHEKSIYSSTNLDWVGF